jgi:hypothetical protein
LGAAGRKKLTGWLLHGGARRSSRALMRGAARWPLARMVGRRVARGRGKAHGGDVGPGGRPEAVGGVEVFTEESGRRQLLGCSGRCSPDALRTATASGSRSRARVHRPGACSPQLLIDGCTVLRREQRGGRRRWRLDAQSRHEGRNSAAREMRRSKLIWPPQRRLTGDKDSGGARGRWSPTAHGHHLRCRVGARAVTGAFG